MYKFIICFIAGIGAGLGTGFAGMSAASAYTYGRNKNIDIRNGIIMGSEYYHGKLFCIYDLAAWNKIYRKTCCTCCLRNIHFGGELYKVKGLIEKNY